MEDYFRYLEISRRIAEKIAKDAEEDGFSIPEKDISGDSITAEKILEMANNALEKSEERRKKIEDIIHEIENSGDFGKTIDISGFDGIIHSCDKFSEIGNLLVQIGNAMKSVNESGFDIPIKNDTVSAIETLINTFGANSNASVVQGFKKFFEDQKNKNKEIKKSFDENKNKEIDTVFLECINPMIENIVATLCNVNDNTESIKKTLSFIVEEFKKNHINDNDDNADKSDSSDE